MATSIAIVVGATGMVGQACVKRLLAHPAYSQVKVVARRKLPFEHPKLEQHIIDFDRMEESASTTFRGDVLFCCLGTTIKKAGSQEVFKRIDFDYPLRASTIAANNGVKKLLLVTSVGADAGSSNFYLSVKGALEEAVKKLSFEALHIFRPSLLLGERQERRLLERASMVVFGKVGFLFQGPLSKYRPIEGDFVARAMVEASLSSLPGTHVHERIG